MSEEVMIKQRAALMDRADVEDELARIEDGIRSASRQRDIERWNKRKAVFQDRLTELADRESAEGRAL